MIRRGGPHWRRARRGQRGTLFLKLLGGGDGAAYMSPEIFNKYKLKCLQCFQLFVLAYYIVSRLLVQTLKVLIWNYSLKCRGLNEHFYTSRLLPQIEDLLSPPNIGPSIYPPMEGPHTNVGTWAPGFLATLLPASMTSSLLLRLLRQ